MRTIETTGVVSNDGKLTVDVPTDVAPGEHRVVVFIVEPDNVPGPDASRSPEFPARHRESVRSTPLTPREGIALAESLGFRVMRLDNEPADATFRREELYGDDGR